MRSFPYFFAESSTLLRRKALKRPNGRKKSIASIASLDATQNQPIRPMHRFAIDVFSANHERGLFKSPAPTQEFAQFRGGKKIPCFFKRFGMMRPNGRRTPRERSIPQGMKRLSPHQQGTSHRSRLKARAIGGAIPRDRPVAPDAIVFIERGEDHDRSRRQLNFHRAKPPRHPPRCDSPIQAL